MTINKFIKSRNIEKVLHYTTNNGLTGMLHTDECQPYSRLTADKRLEYILKPACATRRRDPEWHGHVNLSLTSINSGLFNIAENKWHSDFKKEGWWCILVFDPIILTHEGVVFCTTNNIYSGVKRGGGLEGMTALFAERVHQYESRYAQRDSRTPNAQPTCRQAEVLYPKGLPVSHLRNVVVRDDHHGDAIHGICAAHHMDPISCIVDPGMFK